MELARRGARILVSDLDLEAAKATVGLLSGAEAHALRCDVAKLDDVQALAERADALFGGADLLINNAGVAVGGRIGEVPHEDWEWILGINLWGAIHGCNVFVPRFRRQKRGHILNVASAAGLLCAPQMGAYNVTKAGVIALSETLYSELISEGIGVTVLCPTFFETNIARSARSANERLLHVIQTMMSAAKISAEDVARIALDGADAGLLHVIPQSDGRWFWRMKRFSPGRFHALVPKLFAWRTRRAMEAR
jgi:NAD(P)-dependent dehydrogenase (short-subunit alcohol dehydrogenase family)